MAFADLGMMGTAGTTTANQNNLVCTATTAGAAVGNLVVVAVSVDNRASGGGDDLSVSGVTDSVGNVYNKARQEATNLAAQAGASVSIWWSVIKTAIPVTTGTITAAFTTNTSSDAQCMAVRKYSIGSGGFVQIAGTAGGTSTTTNPGSLNVTTLNREYLRIRAIGCEYDSTQTLTVTGGGWAAWTEAASAATGTIVEQCLEVEWLINTGTGTASAPTLGSACDNSSVYVAFQEVTPVPEIIDPPKKTVRTTSQTLALIAALSAVAEPVFVPPSVPETTTQTSVHSTAVVVPSRVVYDQTSTPAFQPVAAATISSTLSSAYGTTTVVTSRVVYDQTSTPVFVPPTVVVTPASGYQTFDVVWLRQRKVRPDGVALPPIQQPVVIKPVASSDIATRARRVNLPDGYVAPVTVPVAAAAALTYGALGTSCTVVRTSIVIGDQTSAPVFPPEPPEPPEPVPGRFVSDAPLNWLRKETKKPPLLSAIVIAYPDSDPGRFVPDTPQNWLKKETKNPPLLSAIVIAYPDPDDIEPISSTLASVHSEAVVVESRVVYDQTAARPVFPPAAPPVVADHFVTDAPQNWLKERNKKPPLLSALVLAYPDPDDIEPISSTLASVHSEAVVVKSRVVYDQTAARPIFPPVFVGVPGRFVPDAPQNGLKREIKKPPLLSAFVLAYPTISTNNVGVYCAVTVITSRVVYDQTSAPVFLPPPSPVVPPGAVTGGGGLGFSYQRYERLVNELYQKKKKAPPKAKKALAKAIEVVKKVDTRAEDLARLLQALEAAAAVSTQNTLAMINAANAAADQARLVLEQQRLRQLREEDDLILLMLEEED